MRLFGSVAWAPEGGADGAAAAGAAAPPAAAPAPGAAAAASTTPPAPVAFAEQLPEDIRGEAAFRDIKDLAGLAKSYFHAQKLIGRDPSTLLPIPAPDDAAGQEALYARLGRPEKPEGYKLPAPPEGLAANPELQTGFQQAAHKAGLNETQARTLVEWWNSQAATMTKAQAETAQRTETEATSALKQEWGAAFDEKLHLAKSALAHYGDEKLLAYLEQTRLGNDPAVLRMFAKIGGQLAEDGVVGRGEGAGRSSPVEAQQQIAGLQSDKGFMKAYMDRRDPGHEAAVKKMQGLYEFAYPAAP